jgi:hypothetical protein
VDHPLFMATCSVLGAEHEAAQALARAVRSDDSEDWLIAKEMLSMLPDAQWAAIKYYLQDLPPDDAALAH